MSDEAPRPFRWQALLQRAGEAVFVLDRRRRLLFVNAAWEQLTETSAEQAHGLLCRRSRPPGPDAAAEDVLAHLLTPPPEALHGAFCRVRRLFPERASGPRPQGPLRCCDVEFLPLRQAGPGEGCIILGRLLPLPAEDTRSAGVVPERLLDLRQRWTGSFSLDLLDSPHPAMQRLAQQVRLACGVRAPVLLVGEPGTGKETIARIIHYQGPQRESAFAALDCRRLPAGLLTSVLFAEPAAGNLVLGAIYLKDPAYLPRDIQLRLCEWLARTASVWPTPDTVSGHPRLFAGTSTAPEDDARSGRLLEELSWRLGPLTLAVPPLRDRRTDLPRLVERALAFLNAEGERRVTGLTPAAADLVRGHTWPGNLAELHQVLADAWKRAAADFIDAGDLPAALRTPQRLEQDSVRSASRPVPLEQTLEEVERRLIRVALKRARGNRSRAADLLGIYRARLLRRMQALAMPEAEGEETE